MTKAQIAAIARASKSLAGDGGFAIFSNGAMHDCASENDVIARGNGRGGWEYRICYIDRPATVADITVIVRGYEDARESEARCDRHDQRLELLDHQLERARRWRLTDFS